MAVCSWCNGELATANSCTVSAFHRDGRRFHMVPFGDEPGWRASGDRCGDCGVPETDITTVHGIRCTTALRTVIDLAPEVEASHLDDMVRDCLERGLFTVEEASRRLAESDMVGRRGAELLRRALPPLGS